MQKRNPYFIPRTANGWYGNIAEMGEPSDWARTHVLPTADMSIKYDPLKDNKCIITSVNGYNK